MYTCSFADVRAGVRGVGRGLGGGPRDEGAHLHHGLVVIVIIVIAMIIIVIIATIVNILK